MTQQIKISIKDAQALAEAIAEITTSPDGDNLAARAIIQQISRMLPGNISAPCFRSTARGGVIDLSGRDYVAQIKGQFA